MKGQSDRQGAFRWWAEPTLRAWSKTAVPVLASVVALLMPLAGHAAANAVDPWAILARARETMQQGGPQLWSFSQTYLPPGFDRGEDETGRVALDLPRCLRWDYDEPYPKSFLQCSGKLYAWNPGEPAGHVYDLDQAEPGLDLLLLAVSDLAQRYTARAEPAGSATRVLLVPKGMAGANPNVLKDAGILIDKDGVLRELTYRDAEDNRTTFRFADRRALGDAGVFTPPANLKWQREGGGDRGGGR